MKKKMTSTCIAHFIKNFHVLPYIEECGSKLASALHGDKGVYKGLSVSDGCATIEISSEQSKVSLLTLTVQELYSIDEYVQNMVEELEREKEKARRKEEELKKATQLRQSEDRKEEDEARLLELLDEYGIPEEYVVKHIH